MLKRDSETINDDALLERLVDSLRAALVDFEDAQSKLISIDGSTRPAPAEIDETNETDAENR